MDIGQLNKRIASQKRKIFIDENGFEYNLHVKCEYVSPLGNGEVVYPLRQEVRIIKAED